MQGVSSSNRKEAGEAMVAVNYRIGGKTLSGIERRPDGSPRGVVLALHGGGYRAGYWTFPPSSLLDIATRRGVIGIAIDRPGYGAAFDSPLPLADQSQLVLDLAELLRRREGGVPLLLVGHSMGGILALIAAADPRAREILTAIDVCGVPLRYPQAMQDSLLTRTPPHGECHYPPLDPVHSRAMFFGADDSFDPAALDYDTTLAAPIPVAEFRDAALAPETLPAAMQRITIPVRLTFAEAESSSIVTDEVAAGARSDLSASARAEVRYEPGSGHNISLHHAATQFHNGIIDWLDANITEPNDP